ncbi:PCI domain-containing protein [Polychytrium aggregatum]|uniref:PCI domain-containing protein n=1 Tax=Polychytrium aggregatum TaxID=110093 RepID=UPI0022FEB9D5|nr:PCI domain-containing protein [Polychytrium aggregatum]KAI9205086.1 PCI domain-containing protein [Polychytrium aggregatum]
MTDSQPVKMEKDLSAVADVQIPESEALAQKGKVSEALEILLVLEKQTRSGADLASNTRVLIQILRILFNAKDWKGLNEHIVLLSKKHGLLKQAITKMTQEAMTFIDKTPDEKTKLELIDTLRVVTEGKIYVEVERARVTRLLVKIKEDAGNISDAADILHELQVETFGSMERREKTDFILEQMRLCLAKKDYNKVQLISKKVSQKFFDLPENQDLKLRYYELMIQHAVHSDQSLNACKYYRRIYDTPSVQEDEQKWTEALRFVVLFIILSPYDNEQSDLIHRINEDKNLAKLAPYKELIKCFTTDELMRWSKITEIYGTLLRNAYIFQASTEDGERRWKLLHDRVVEHNIRVISKYYTRISTKRATELLDLPVKDVEEFLSKMVVSKTIYARIDRSAGVISFVARKDPNAVLNDWSNNINQLLELIDKCGHLIAKEEMVYSITKTV